MTDTPKRNWEGLEIVHKEDPEDTVLVWEIDPYLGNHGYDVAIVREWQRMLSFIEDRLEDWLED
jgi:hypothetical protein